MGEPLNVTPAMEAGVSNRLWSLTELVERTSAWHVRRVAPSGYAIKDAMPYAALEDAIKQARYWLSQGATDAWIVDTDGNRMGKPDIEASGSN